MSYEHLKGMEGYTEETVVIGKQVLKYAHYIDPELNSGDKENGAVWVTQLISNTLPLIPQSN